MTRHLIVASTLLVVLTLVSFWAVVSEQHRLVVWSFAYWGGCCTGLVGYLLACVDSKE